AGCARTGTGLAAARLWEPGREGEGGRSTIGLAAGRHEQNSPPARMGAGRQHGNGPGGDCQALPGDRGPMTVLWLAGTIGAAFLVTWVLRRYALANGMVD